MPLGSARLRIVPASGKIYDITHADTLEHSTALPAGYPENTKAIYVRATRMAGTGVFYARSVFGVADSRIALPSGEHGLWIRATDGLFYYRLSAANDDWDIYAVGYIAG